MRKTQLVQVFYESSIKAWYNIVQMLLTHMSFLGCVQRSYSCASWVHPEVRMNAGGHPEAAKA